MYATKFSFEPANENSPESVHDNVFWQGAAPRLSVCVPSYRHDCSDLIDALARCKQGSLAEIIIYDDGSQDHTTLAKMQYQAGCVRAAVRIVSHGMNRGRAAARNAAIAHARSEWVLLLDADMSPDSGDFISNYLDVTERLDDPAVVVGGYSLRFASPSKKFALHRWQAETSECIDAAKRSQAPYVSRTCTVCAHTGSPRNPASGSASRRPNGQRRRSSHLPIPLPEPNARSPVSPRSTSRRVIARPNRAIPAKMITKKIPANR